MTIELVKKRGRGRPRLAKGSAQRVQPYLAKDLHTRLVDYCTSKGLTKSSVIHAAVTQYLDGMSDFALVMRRLDRLGRSFDRSHRDLELLSQAFSLFLQVWLAQAPTIPPLQKDAARRASAGRFKQFMEHLAEEFSNGRRFLDDLPKDAFPNDDELRAIALANHDAGTPKGDPS